MSHPIYRVTAFRIIGAYTLLVTFDDHTQQRIDFEPVLKGPLFGPLRELEYFDQVRLDDDAGTLVWPTGADFDPATLHDWPELKDELTRRAESWAASADSAAAKPLESTRR